MAVTNKPVLTKEQRNEAGLEWVDRTARLLDTRFRIPGTNIRFGADFLLGLIPGAGDVISLLLSGSLVITMARHGASGRVLLKMLFNVALDALVGTIPVLGDIFDLAYKANYRNLQLLKDHYEVGAHRGSARPFIVGLLVVILLVVVVILWGMLALIWWMGELLANSLVF